VSAGTVSAASGSATHKVIVLLKDQPAAVSKSSAGFASRLSKIAANQAPIASQLRATSKNVKAYQLVNALSATVSTSEEQQLQSNPSVASIVPDEVIHAAPSQAAAADAYGPATRTPPAGVCPTGTATQTPEELEVTKTQSDDPKTKTARSLGFTGKGVKVAYLAEGIDINNPEFIRPDGSHVFTDYQDFSGDGTAAPTSGDEAFLDASAIAAQGSQVYDLKNYTADPLSTSCNIRVEGVAPGASLIGLKVFAQNNATTTSAFLQAINYAVNVDKVDVLNESFGGNPFPDTATADAVASFDEAAVNAGVTVTVSSGDAGPTNTIGSPATDPDVISVGASTTHRLYAQTGYGGYYPLAKGGWLNDQVSPLSSSGLSESGTTIDMLAPGDLTFAACSTDTAMYEGCTSLAGNPSPIEDSGGTSESAPMTAGGAALVIEAYRSTHNGASPTPAQVKQVLVSTADDLGHPGDEQGSGRLDTYQAVLAAMSLHDANGTPAAVGSTILTNASQLDASALPGTAKTFALTLTNNGSAPHTVKLGQRTLGPELDTHDASVTLSDTASQHFSDYAGDETNYQVSHFTIPAGRDRLDVDYVYPGDPAGSLNGRVRLALIDPNGVFAAHSLPQGVGNAGHVDVSYPAGGTWTVMIWSRQSAVGGTTGVVTYHEATHDYHQTGSVWPSTVTLAAGQSRTVRVSAVTPIRPGDQSNSVTIDQGNGVLTSVPVALRSLVDVKRGGFFSGLLKGGNGRDSNTGQAGFLQFDVPAGQKDLTANFALTGHVTDPVYGYLIDPSGNSQANTTNVLTTGFDPSTGAPITTPISTMSLFVRAPAAGRWTLILDFAPAVSGTHLAVPYIGEVVLNQVRAGARVPDNAHITLKAGKAVTVPVTVRNTGVAPESFFIDPRLDQYVNTPLANLAPGPYALPLLPTSSDPVWNVPTETTQLAVGVTSTLPVNFDFGWQFGYGDPDIAGVSTGTSASGMYSGSPVPSGTWFAAPADIGPYGTAGAPAATANATISATIKAFDPAVSSPIGDLEVGAVNPAAEFDIVNVNPGKSITIPVTITPAGKKGTVVSGQLYVDDLSLIAIPGLLPAGQELAAIPYKYRIG
jgi:hypothetical protein